MLRIEVADLTIFYFQLLFSFEHLTTNYVRQVKATPFHHDCYSVGPDGFMSSQQNTAKNIVA